MPEPAPERTPPDDTTEMSREGIGWHWGPDPAFGFMTTHVGPRERCTGPDCEPEPDNTTEGEEQ